MARPHFTRQRICGGTGMGTGSPDSQSGGLFSKHATSLQLPGVFPA